MIPELQFDPRGGLLWIDIQMSGLYFMSYTYQLWSANPDDFPILTKPLRSGSNVILHDDYYQVFSDYMHNESVANNVGRIIDVRFWVKKVEDDNGYQLSVRLLQGNSIESATPLNAVSVNGVVDGQSIKEEFITFKLIL